MKKRYEVDHDERRSVPVCFKMKPSHHDKLTGLAKDEDRSITSLMERMIVAYFKKNKV